MVKKRNRKTFNRRRKSVHPEVKATRRMAMFRFKCPNVLDYLRRIYCAVWSRRAAFSAITGVFALLALTFKKPDERGGGGGDPETGGHAGSTAGRNVPQDTDEPRAVICHEPPAEYNRELPTEYNRELPAEFSREPAAEVPCGEGEEEEEEEEEYESRDFRVNVSDELYCDYDSTWETEEAEETAYEGTNLGSWRPKVSNYKFGRFKNAARDMQNYRHNYPSKSSTTMWGQRDDKPNLKFYKGLRTTAPDEVHIEEFHSQWYGQYEQLEYVHTYIQWLFPLQEPGVNYEATPLTKEEIEDFLQDSTAMSNLFKSYKLMLDFYGIQLWNVKTGEVKRAHNWRERFINLDSKTHNNLRITRILKCLGTLGFAHYQAPLVRFFLEETLVHGQLQSVKDSVLNYFVFAVLDKTKRRSLIKFAYLHYNPKDEFVWCPKRIQVMWSQPSQRGAMISEDDTEDDSDQMQADYYR